MVPGPFHIDAGRLLLTVVAATLLSACGVPLPLRGGPAALTPAQYSMLSESEASTARSTAVESDELPVVAVRSYWRSPHFTVVAWHPDDAAFGLRGVVRRDDATLVREHTLYISTFAFVSPNEYAGAFWHAFTALDTPGRTLIPTGVLVDVASCEGDVGCSPFRSVTARVPDKVLRNSPEGLAVKLVTPHTSRVFVLGRPLIDAYLAEVDAVRGAVLRRVAADH